MFLFHNIDNKIYKLNDNLYNKNINILIFKDFENQLSINKEKIDSIDKYIWNSYKKKQNIYELIYTSSNNINKNICDFIPVSRSYYKLYQILYDFNLIKKYNNIACLAEGPGGFIECFNKLINYNRIDAIPLLSNDINIPNWSSKILKLKKVFINNGMDNTGNIYNIFNAIYFIKNTNKCDFITADGGFDTSDSFNSQELDTYQLIYSEIFIALNIQKKGGNFIIKIFDIFYNKTIQLLYLLYLSYEKLYIFKPDFSRLSNSEKYIVAVNFKGAPGRSLDDLQFYYENPLQFMIDIPSDFIHMINNFNQSFIKKQIFVINDIIDNYIHKSKSIDKLQKEKAIEWCNKYNIKIKN